MYLDKLVIRTSSSIVREITFKKGLNLIIDETTSASTDSGNNVGKTTFLRVIDFCLGGGKDGIYIDKEFQRRNEKLYSYLFNNKVVFELTLKTKLGKTHSIVRPIDGKSSIDSSEISSEVKFRETLFQLLFQTKAGRPTLSQIMNKFIRIEEYQITNALYFLYPTSDMSEYEALFMFLFGFRDTELLGRKRRLVDSIKKLRKTIEDAPQSLNDLEQQLHLINKELTEQESLKTNLDFGKDVEIELGTLKNLQSRISDLKSDVARLNLKHEMNISALRQISESKTNINSNAILSLYNQAKVEIPNLQKKFEEVLSFHNQMVDNKIIYIKSVLKTVETQLQTSTVSLNSCLKEESKIIGLMSKKGALDEYDKMNLKIQEKSREKGVKEGLIQGLGQAERELTETTKELETVNNSIKEFAHKFNESLKQFNEFFSEFSEKLYGDKYYLSTQREHNKTTDNYLLDIGNMNENIGTGKKKAQISALDLAYLRYSEQSAYSLPLFILHDQLETVFENQIDTLFEVSNSINGQFVVAVLSDKLHKIDKEKVTQNCILRLSQSDKLFKLN